MAGSDGRVSTVLPPTTESSIAATNNHRAWRRQLTAFAYRNADALFPAETSVLAHLTRELAQARVLDIGIGTGRTTGHIAPRCARYVGVDYSPEMIGRARERFPSLDLRVVDARDLGTVAAPAAPAFDLVIFSYNGIDYVDHEDRLRILGQIHRVLRPGGDFMFSAHRLGVAIPPATALVNLTPSANPLRTFNNTVKYVQGIRNAHRLKGQQRHETEYALLNDSAQQYQMLTYYIAPAAQLRQLERAGFTQVRAFAQSGLEIDPAAPSSPANEDDYMVHYLARRATQPAA